MTKAVDTMNERLKKLERQFDERHIETDFDSHRYTSRTTSNENESFKSSDIASVIDTVSPITLKQQEHQIPETAK